MIRIDANIWLKKRMHPHSHSHETKSECERSGKRWHFSMTASEWRIQLVVRCVYISFGKPKYRIKFGLVLFRCVLLREGEEKEEWK